MCRHSVNQGENSPFCLFDPDLILNIPIFNIILTFKADQLPKILIMGNQIQPSDAKKLLKNWKNGPGNAINGKGFKDSFETWFSVEELQEYLNYVKENSNGPNPGIRIYFGKYEQGGGPNPVKGLSTVFLAPTTGGNGGNLDDTHNDYTLNAYNSGGTKYPPAEYK